MEKKVFLVYSAICVCINRFFFVSNKKLSKHTSRMAAVQVMYQKDMTDTDLDKIISNFIIHYINEEESYDDINLSFFKKLTSHFSDDIDFEVMINQNLQDDKTMGQTAYIAKSIIKVAVIEMMFENTDLPIIMNEYIEISKCFVDEKSVKFINAILDKISKQVVRTCQAKA